MNHWLLILLFCGSWALFDGQANSAGAAEPDLGDLRLIRILPRTEDEIAHAYERANASACEPVPAEEPLEITGFTPYLTELDRAELNRGKLLLPSTRRNMLTVGLSVLESDKPRLPTVSRGRILDYLENHYVSIQARVQKDPISGELFLHHRPLAATTSFGRGRLTESFTDPTLLAVKDFHSLGIFLPSGLEKTPQNLRTLVMIYRSLTVGAVNASGKARLDPEYEWVFVRGRQSMELATRQLVLHIFCTSGHRQRLHRLQPWSMPKNPKDCGIHAAVLFTEYTTLGLIPSKSATRNVTYRSESIFEWKTLDDYGREQGWTGDSLDNLHLTLDAIIEGKIQIVTEK